MNDEFREMMNREEIFDSDVMICSVNPSVKYSCFGSPVMFSNGSTTIDGLSGSGKAVFSVRKEKIPGEEIVGSIYFLTTRFATTGRSATARVKRHLLPLLEPVPGLPDRFPERVRLRQDAIHLDRFRDVRDAVRPQGLIPDAHLVLHMIVDAPGDADASRVGQPLQPGRDVDTVPVDVPPFLDHIPEIDPDPEGHPGPFRLLFVPPLQLVLYFHGALHRVDHAVEPGEKSVAVNRHDAAPGASRRGSR